jgi:hypothetical protein
MGSPEEDMRAEGDSLSSPKEEKQHNYKKKKPLR